MSSYDRVGKLFRQKESNTTSEPRLRIFDRKSSEEEYEIGTSSDFHSDFESDFLVAFHCICKEFLMVVLQRQKVKSLSEAISKGLIDLDAFSAYMEYCAASIIKGYEQVFPHYGGIDLCRVGIHTSFDRKLNDVVCKISFFR